MPLNEYIIINLTGILLIKINVSVVVFQYYNVAINTTSTRSTSSIVNVIIIIIITVPVTVLSNLCTITCNN